MLKKKTVKEEPIKKSGEIQTLKEYIHNNIEAGYSYSAIKQQLLISGWSEEKIEQATNLS